MTIYLVHVWEDRERHYCVGAFQDFADALTKAEEWRQTGSADYLKVQRLTLDGHYGPHGEGARPGNAGHEVYTWWKE